MNLVNKCSIPFEASEWGRVVYVSACMYMLVAQVSGEWCGPSNSSETKWIKTDNPWIADHPSLLMPIASESSQLSGCNQESGEEPSLSST